MTADEWNEQHPTGTKVRVRYRPAGGALEHDDARTCSAAVDLQVGTAMVQVERWGLMGLDQLQVLEDSS